MTTAYSKYISETIRSLFEKEKLNGLIAFVRGTIPFKPHPAVFHKPDEVANVVFNGFCVQNLATYLKRHQDKRLGILVKGCDQRAIRVLIQERQIERGRLFIIGVPCPGMLNRAQLLEEFPGLKEEQLTEEDEILFVQTPDGIRNLKRTDYLLPTCKVCHHRVPEGVDVLLEPPPFTAPEEEGEFRDLVEPISDMPRGHREALFTEELSRCILCYACRNICPLCYCDTCFADSLQPVWMSSSPEPNNIFFYHVNRMMHMAGRCVACGSCEWACPEHIQLHLLYGKVVSDVADLFSYEAGLDETIPQPLSSFSEDDTDEHIG